METESIKTPKKYPWERAMEGFFIYMATKPKTKWEYYDKMSLYILGSTLISLFLVVLSKS